MSKYIDIPLLEQMLAYISADGSRDEWVKILMAIKSEFGDNGFDSALAWSETSPSYKFNDFDAAWKSINAAGKTSIATLIHEAKQNGFKFEPMTDAEKERLQLESAERAQIRKKQQEFEQKRLEQQHASAREVAIDIWQNAKQEGQSEYAKLKGITPFAARYSKDGKNLIIPAFDEKGAIWNTQTIYPNSTKMFQKGGAKSGKMLMHPGQILSDFVLITTGYATFCTLHEATGLQTIAAFDDGNLPKVIHLIKKQRPDIQILICTDDDYLQTCRSCRKRTEVETDICQHCGKPHGQKNSGLQSARKAAIKYNCEWVAPVFPQNRDGQTDFNDLANMQGGGLQIVKEQIFAAIQNAGINAKPATAAGVSQQGEGEARPTALSYMPIEDIVQRFIYVDDVHGDNAFDVWTKDVVKVKKVQSLLPPRVRWDDVKEHPVWQSNAVYRDQIGFDPTEKDKNILCNRWSGWPTKPNKNSTIENCQNLLRLLSHLCDEKQNGSDVYQWVLKWLAYPIQNPGAKMDTAIIFHGPQGTGKNMFFEAYGKIFGDHFSVITQDTMEDQFNSDWVDRKLFVLADEIVAVQERTHVKNKLKTMITGDRIRVNQKMIAAYPEKNFFNMVFLSNEANPVVLEKRDRRYLTIWTPPAIEIYKKDQQGNDVKVNWYKAVKDEIDNGGIEALHNYLLQIDVGDFTSNSHPPMTEAKQNLILLNADTPFVFYHAWKTGELDIPFGPAPSDLIYQVYRKWCVANGEPWPFTSRRFLSSLQTEGVRSEHKNRRKNYNPESGNTKSRFYTPPQKDIEEAKTKMHHVLDPLDTVKHGTGIDFYTECYMQFSNEIEKAY